jgi:L-malate glycosyltransferase
MVSHAPIVGGAELSLLDCASHLVHADGFKACVAAPEDSEIHLGASTRALPSLGYPAVRLEGCTNWGARVHMVNGLVQEVFSLRKMYRTQGHSLVHANGFKAALSAIPAAKLARVPSVLHIRDYPRNPWLLRILTALADAVIAPSKFISDGLLDFIKIDQKKLCIIPNGVACPVYSVEHKEEIRRELRISPDAFLVSMVAQFAPWKRHDLLLEAIAILCQRGLNIHAAIVGRDLWELNQDYVQSLYSRAERPDLSGRISFLGQREDVGNILAASDAMVLPSKNEPFGRVVVEAWWTGTPVVVSNIGGPAELVEHNCTGLHFEDGNLDSLADAIERLVHAHAFARKLTEKAKEEAPRYSVERNARSIAQLYRELIPCA